ncbi:MAG: TetR/AcrR family transcriptional regulator [Atribacterota bacterium]|nr:TetR/AcrR family transcriptional regulator [Atribacterota bacterium]MDD5637354.1 TetR/AcrR family transcriptional regulator [Atribacterota bacterium]
MPKFIDGIIEKIYQAAFYLFTVKGYQQVTMKMIAQEAGLSVGTLYNYFLNKQDLFLNVFRQSLEQTYAVLDKMIEESKEDRYNFIATLYNEIVRLKELGRVILREKLDHELFEHMKDYLLGLIRNLVYKAEEKKDLDIPDKDKDRTIRLLIMAIYDFAQEFPDEQEDNINFICRLVDKIK